MSLITESEKLRELEQKATPGPWSWYAEDSSMCWLGQTDNEEENFVLGSQTCKACTERGARCLQPKYEDRQMIAKSRNLAPFILEVLGMIREGDAAALGRIFMECQEAAVSHFMEPKDECVLKRFQQMAALMEKER